MKTTTINDTNNNKAHNSSSTKMLILAAIFTAVNVVCAQIQIPIAPVPISLATFAIFLTAGLLGHKYGSLSLIVYVLLGAIGVPVFAGFSGGFGIITGPTGGYIIGYIFTAFITGAIIDSYMAKSAAGEPVAGEMTRAGEPATVESAHAAESAGAPARRRSVPPYPVLILAMIAGLAACYLLGTIWFIHLTGWTIGKALMTCVVVFLPGDALKIILAAILIRKLYPAASSFRAI